MVFEPPWVVDQLGRSGLRLRQDHGLAAVDVRQEVAQHAGGGVGEVPARVVVVLPGLGRGTPVAVRHARALEPFPHPKARE